MKIDYQKRYRDYLKSDHWARLRVESSNLWGDGCYVCAKHPVDFYHLTYRTLLDCTADDVIPLCRNCHQGIHFKAGKIFRAVRCAKTNDEKRSLIKSGMVVYLEERCTEAQRDFAAYQKRVSDGKRVTIEAIRRDRMERAKNNPKSSGFVNYSDKVDHNKNRNMPRERKARLKKQREEEIALAHEKRDDIVTLSIYENGVLCPKPIPWVRSK